MNDAKNQLLRAAAKIAAALLAKAEQKSAGSYRSGIYDAARAFWKEGSRGNFMTRMKTHIKFGLREAWNAGASAAGVEPDEFEADDTAQIESIISTEQGYLSGLLDFLDQLANDPGKTLADANPRLDMWGNRWQDVYNQALVWFGDKIKLKWIYGPTEHCETCQRLNGIVAWAREWETADIHPQSHRLACHGYNCQCRLEPTKQRRSPRALTTIMNIVMAGE